MKHVWISAELRGGSWRIKRRLAGSIWHGIASRLPETSRSLGTPQIVVQIGYRDQLLLFFVLGCFVRKNSLLFVTKWPATQLTSAAGQQQ